MIEMPAIDTAETEEQRRRRLAAIAPLGMPSVGGPPDIGPPGRTVPGMPPVSLSNPAIASPAAQPVAPKPDSMFEMPAYKAGPAEQREQQMLAQGPPQLHGFKKGLDILGQVFLPSLEQAIPGSPGHYTRELGQATEGAETERKHAAESATLGNVESQRREREAKAQLELAKANTPAKSDSLDQQYSDAVADAIQRGVDPNSDPKVLQLADAKTRLQKDTAPKSTKEQIQSQINAELAKPNPDQKLVKTLQGRLKAIDPMGSERLGITISQKGQEEKSVEAAAQALAAGDLTRLKDISSFRGDQRLLIYARAKEINPQFNTAKVDRQIKMLDNYTTGKQGDQLQSFGTFLEHAGALADTMKNLSGTTDVKILNKPINWLRQNVGNDAQYQRVLAALDPVQKEFEAYLLNNRALYTEDRATVDKIVNGDLSPNQLVGALEQMGHTVQARFTEANKRFKNTMGKNIEEVVGPLSDEAVAGAAKIGVKVGIGPNTTQSGAGGHVISMNGKQYQYNGSGDTADMKNYTEVKKP